MARRSSVHVDFLLAIDGEYRAEVFRHMRINSLINVQREIAKRTAKVVRELKARCCRLDQVDRRCDSELITNLADEWIALNCVEEQAIITSAQLVREMTPKQQWKAYMHAANLLQADVDLILFTRAL